MPIGYGCVRGKIYRNEQPLAEPSYKMIPTKVCEKCGEEKPLIKFRLMRDTDDGHSPVCSDCELLERPRRKKKL